MGGDSESSQIENYDVEFDLGKWWKKKSIRASSAWRESSLSPSIPLLCNYDLLFPRQKTDLLSDRSEEMELNGNLCATFTQSSV